MKVKKKHKNKYEKYSLGNEPTYQKKERQMVEINKQNNIQLVTKGCIGKLTVGDKDISNNVIGVDIKIRAGKLPEVTVYANPDTTNVVLSEGLLKLEQPGYIVKGENCGRDENGVFHCVCGKCEIKSTEG